MVRVNVHLRCLCPCAFVNHSRYPRRSLDTSDPFLDTLLAAIPDKIDFPDGSPAWRRAYFLLVSIAVACRIGDTHTERKFGVRTDDSMPKSLQDKPPPSVVDAFFEQDTRASAASGEAATRVKSWGEALHRTTMVRKGVRSCN